MKSVKLLLLPYLLIVQSVYAENHLPADTNSASTISDPSPSIIATWKGDIELGIVNTTGNTETSSIKGKATAVLDNKPWRHSLLAESYNADDDGNTTAERYLLGAKTDYKYSKVNYWYFGIRYEADRFSGFDYQVTESVGYGRRLIESKYLTLDAETGPGARQSKLDSGDSEDEFLWRLAGNLFWKISKHSEFTQSISSEIGEDSTISRSSSGLKSQIAERLAMKLSYVVKHTSDVPADVSKTETETIVTIVYSF